MSALVVGLLFGPEAAGRLLGGFRPRRRRNGNKRWIADWPLFYKNEAKQTVGKLPSFRIWEGNYVNHYSRQKHGMSRERVRHPFIAWMVSLLVLLVFSTPASSVTREQAHDLPVSELAALVLGEAGALVIDVERPHWTIGAPFGVSPDEAAKGLPPVNWLRFYFRASAVSTNSGTDGLCMAQSVDVTIDQLGKPTMMSVNTIYGPAKPLSRPNLQVFDYRAADQTLDALCRALPTTRQFFYASGVLDPSSVAYALSQVHAAMVSGGAKWLKTSCDAFGGGQNDCATSAAVQAMAEAADLSHVGQIDPAKCSGLEGSRKGSRDEQTSDRCFNVHLQTDGCRSTDNIELQLAGGMGGVFIRQASFSRSAIVC